MDSSSARPEGQPSGRLHGMIPHMLKKYVVKEENKNLDKEIGHRLVSQLLSNRGIKTFEEAQRFLNPDFDRHLHDPFLLPDMEKAVGRILKAIESNEKIAIWSDYDADGIPGGAIFHDFLKLIGYENFINYIPDRHLEGYGLNEEGIKELSEKGASLLITIDCGIRDHDKIDFASKLDIETIITDHHEPAEELPKAHAIVNPKRTDSEYPEKILCGSGVVWKLIEAILKTKRNFTKDDQPLDVTQGKEKWLLDLVGLATLSDMVPLTGENRVLAHFGLKVMRKNKRLGLKRLFSLLKISEQYINEDDIGFLVTPRINAASRMGKPKDAFNLLIAKTDEEADVTARYLDTINKERKVLVSTIVREAHKIVNEKIISLGEKPVIVVGNPSWRPALLGLAANSLVEMYQKPVFMWGREGGEYIKGSCRSNGSCDLVALMEKSKGSFIEFGGHKMSGGFSVDHEMIHRLEESLILASGEIVNEVKDTTVDAEIKLNEINRKIFGEISKLAPFGIGNEKPVFLIRSIIPKQISRFGKAKEHLSVILTDGTNSIKAISFFTEPDAFGDALKEGIATNAIVNIEESFFAGRPELRLRIVDFFLD